MPDILHAQQQKLFTTDIKSAVIINAVKVELRKVYKTKLPGEKLILPW